LDEFFQKLREIQKKERSLSGLSRVGDDFYHQISQYFNDIMGRIDDNPFSFESYILRDAQRIVAEICERREHKIANSAVMNVQRSYQLFKDFQKEGRPKIPSNSTPEEEELYKELFKSLAMYRENMRVPLSSYSLKKQVKSGFTVTASKNPSESRPSESRPSESRPSESSPSESRTSESPEDETNGPVETKDLGDEIPPEVEKEIYQQFGKEPSHEHSPIEKEVEDDKGFPGKLENQDGLSLKDRDLKDQGELSLKNQDLKDQEGIKELKSLNEAEKRESRKKYSYGTFDGGKTPGNVKISTEVLMILEELPSIMGVDSNVYGPFYPGDLITMPEPNARILIKNHKGRSIQRYK
jgi:DNA replication factor GINS